MIKEISIINSLDERLNCELACPEKSGFAITEISGIEPFEADIKTTQLVSGDGYIFNKALNKSRTIGIKITFYADNYEGLDIKQLRIKLYKYFKVGDKVKLYINSEERQVAIEGYVSTNKPTIFSDSCGADISIICPKPQLWSKDVGFLKDLTIVSEQKLTASGITKYIVYSGDIKTHFKMIIEFIDDEVSSTEAQYLSGFDISITNSKETRLKFTTPATPLAITTNDKIVIDTGVDEFSIFLCRGSDDPINMMQYCDFIAEDVRNGLPRLEPGKNTISISYYVNETTTDGLKLNINIKYPIIYMGV